MPLTHDEIARTVENLWALMLNREVEPCDPSGPEAPPLLTGAVPIRGDWEGTVSLRCPEGLARAVAASLFGMDTAAVGDAEARDALGELTNIIGGNLKGLLLGACRLGLPTVTSGGTAPATAAPFQSRAAFRSDGHVFVVLAMLTPNGPAAEGLCA